MTATAGLRTEGLTPGARYRAVFRTDDPNSLYELVLPLLEAQDDVLLFDGRPEAGTQTVRIQDLVELWLSGRSKLLPSPIAPEVRVY
jgi:hypothetical protein